MTEPDRQQALEEAESTLEAIKSGRVDAFVIAGSEVVMLERASLPYRTVIEHMHQGAVTVAPEGEIVFVNGPFAAMIGVLQHRLLGKPLAAFVAQGDRAALANLLSVDDVARVELNLRRADGGTIATLATMAKLDAHRLILFKDLAREKRHAAADERARKFLGMLAQELKGMLEPVAEAARVLKREPADAQTRAAALELIERESARLLALAEELGRINPAE